MLEYTIDHRNYLWYLRVPVAEKDVIKGEKELQVHNAVISHAKLHIGYGVSNTLLCIPVAEKDVIKGGKESQVHSAATSHAKLHK